MSHISTDAFSRLRNSAGLLQFLKNGSSAAALAAALSLAAATGAHAQAADGVETVTVTGFAASLDKALDDKRQATGSQDSILAEDIAKFPDINLSESIQRIPGVALARDQGEGREIAVRGLSPLFTRVRINGMEAITTTGAEDVNGGTNRGRAFDFNVFASDLFSGITVHKTESADIEEGSLGATVDLKTAHPFDHSGFTFVASGQAGYNDLSGAGTPRLAALVSDTFLGGHLGVLGSAAYSVNRTTEVGTSSVRFQNDNTNPAASHGAPLIAGCETNVPGTTNQCSTAQRFLSVTVQATGLPGTVAQTAGTVETVGARPNGANFSATALPNDYDVVNEAYHARFPRYDLIYNTEKRLGLTGSVQYQPDDATLFTLDALFADFSVVRNEQYLEAPSFSANGVSSAQAPAGTPPLLANALGIGSIAVTNYTVNEATNNVSSLSATGVGLRTEHRLDHLDTRFQQLTLDGTRAITDAFNIHLLLGWSESHHRNPIQTTLTMDYDCNAADSDTGTVAGCPGGVGGGAGTAASPYTNNYAGANQFLPAISYGNVNVTSPNGWYLSQIRERANYDYNSYRNVQLDGEYKVSPQVKIQAGFEDKNFGYRTVALARTNGSTAALDSFIPSDMEAHAALSGITELVTLKGIDVPTGTPATWIVPDINAASKQFHIFDQTAENFVWPAGGTAAAPCISPGTGCSAFLLGPQQMLTSNGSVSENDVGGWVMGDWDTTISLFGDLPFRGNIGGRYAETSTDAVGFSYDATAKAIVPVTVHNSYHDFLPSLNAVIQPRDEFLVRLELAQDMSRPDLPNLLPGAAVTKSGATPITVTSQNPNLKPYRAKTADISFEYYYAKGALVSVAGFYKHLDTLISSQTLNIPYKDNPLGLPDSLALSACGGTFTAACNTTNIAQFKTTINQKGAPLYGTEINWQQPFDFLDGWMQNLGFLANYTYVQAQQTYFNPDGTIQAIADLPNLSRDSYNATLYYDDTVFQARVSASARTKFIPTGGVNPGGLNDVIVQEGSINVDASTSYKYNDALTFSLEALNLTNQHSTQYVDSVGQRDYYDHATGRQFFVGVRYSY
jgi:TonB-dependent receptor